MKIGIVIIIFGYLRKEHGTTIPVKSEIKLVRYVGYKRYQGYNRLPLNDEYYYIPRLAC